LLVLKGDVKKGDGMTSDVGAGNSNAAAMCGGCVDHRVCNDGILVHTIVLIPQIPLK